MEMVVSRRTAIVIAAGLAGAIMLVLAAMTRGAAPDVARAASHREAPLISLDGPADITDFFMFRSYEPGKSDKVVMLMDVMSEEPSSGPNYWNFDPSVTYRINVDNDKDGRADDVRFEFKFENEIRGIVNDAGLPLSYVALPPITALDGPGSEGLGLRQKYTVRMFKGNRGGQTLARGLIAVPSNVGPRTTPNYDALAKQGVYTLDGGVKVFAGQRQDPFYIDLGGAFDTLNLRRPIPSLTVSEDANDTVNPFGTDMLSGFNVHTIALEVPATLLTGDTGTTTLGAYASTARPQITTLGRRDGQPRGDGGPVQVQRLANPLINELIIGTKDKDRWNATAPSDEADFLDYYLNPRLALALELVYGVPAAKNNRTDLRDLLLKYQPSDQRLSELLRLNLAVPPTPLAQQKRLTVLAGDNAGWPNGRRPKDDVTDVALRVVGGPNYANARAGDGVNADDVANTDTFPFIGTPWNGRDRQHDNP